MSASSPANLYGRQGGGWTDHDGADRAGLAAIARARKAGIADGTWPSHNAHEVGRPSDGDEGYTWEGCARMARARQAAGLPPGPFDIEALSRP